MSYGLSTLGACEPREVGDIERNCSPETHGRIERRNKEFQEIGKALKSRGRGKHWAKATSPQGSPSEQEQAHSSRMGALSPCRKRMYSIPFNITDKLISQNARKQMPAPCGTDLQEGQTVESKTLIASPPIQVWIPNQPQATNARNIAAMLAPSTPNDARASTGNGIP